MCRASFHQVQLLRVLWNNVRQVHSICKSGISWQVLLTFKPFQKRFLQVKTNQNGCGRCGVVELQHGWQHQPPVHLWVHDVFKQFHTQKCGSLPASSNNPNHCSNTTVPSTINSIAWDVVGCWWDHHSRREGVRQRRRRRRGFFRCRYVGGCRKGQSRGMGRRGTPGDDFGCWEEACGVWVH